MKLEIGSWKLEENYIIISFDKIAISQYSNMKNIETKTRLINIFPAFWAALFDIIITIYFQPKEYWDGNLKNHNEANPIGSFAMNESIYGIFVISIIWLILILIMGLFLPKNWISYTTLFILLCHTVGASSWIMMHFGFNYIFILIAINSFLFLKMNYKHEMVSSS